MMDHNNDRINEELIEDIDHQIRNIQSELNDLGNTVNHIKRIVRSQPLIFRDVSKLDFDYVKDNIAVRNKYLTQLEKIFKSGLFNNQSITAIINGAPSTGKTATIKNFEENIKKHGEKSGKRIEIIFVNCRRRKTETSVLLKIVQHFQPSFPDRGFSGDEMIDVIMNHLTDDKIHLIIILEEANVFIEKNGTSLIHDILHNNHIQHISGGSVSLIIISRKENSDLSDIKSLLQGESPYVIDFQPFEYDEIQYILNHQISLAFHEGVVEPGVVDHLARITMENQDLRIALELLWKAGYDAELNDQTKVTSNNILKLTSDLLSINDDLN